MCATASRSASGSHGFTLLEVLITIALIALLTSVLVVGTNRLLRSRPLSADELFWAAAAATRKDALLNNRDVRLTLDAKSNSFVALSADGLETRYPFVVKETAELDFLAPKALGLSSSVLLGGQLVETATIPFVMFYGDGTCSPFRVQLKTRLGARVLEIDPWTCAPILAAQAL
ncbi:pilus assembly FimT family protein [Rariglobus hedericola]|uniref:Prepilin-type N-terminal cleavage/methylation domain-containing protein n=1 Tax=Rariglobus hedericola TaxID=2597822 RepID=A0A556QJR1_9BACT|nr:prepilin-type N-terminal cleavage/methylation domain-containing protein [Rariglobus hedericola]TSJ76869.1 prepilin-type N-terminal cleavage/methylation domain-containing protein [Rariglobus hedericola]